MSALAELTQADGRRVGIPIGAAVVIMGLKEPPPEHAKAKVMVRWCAPGMSGAFNTFVRDDLKHVRNLFPTAVGGLGWTELESFNGDTLLVPAGSATGGYTEVKEDEFQIILNVPTGPLTFVVKSKFGDIRKLAGAEGPAPRRPKAVNETP